MMITMSLAGCVEDVTLVDSDNDTIPDVEDLCPDTDTGLSVDSNGGDNQLDDDGDL